MKPATAAQKPADLATYRHLALQVSQTGGVAVSDAGLERIQKRIVEAIRKKQADRFLEITGPAPPEAATQRST